MEASHFILSDQAQTATSTRRSPRSTRRRCGCKPNPPTATTPLQATNEEC